MTRLADTRRRWLVATTPLAAGVVLLLLTKLLIAAAGGYDRGDPLYVLGAISIVLVGIGVVVLAAFAGVRFVVWAGRQEEG